MTLESPAILPTSCKQVNGAQTTTSTSSSASAARGRRAAVYSWASLTVLFIFQFAAIIGRRAMISSLIYSSGRTAMPGNSLPSTYSSEAPPPVEIWLIRSSSPSLLTAATESPPPTTLVAPLSATALATPSVPLAKASISKTPIGPFQKMVLAPEIYLLKRSTVSGPMSRPTLPDGMPSTATVSDSAPSSMASATTTSTGSTSLSPASSMSRFASSRYSSSTRESPTSYLWALKNVNPMAPPMSKESAVPNRLSITPSLSETFAPPRMATKGRSGSSRILSR